MLKYLKELLKDLKEDGYIVYKNKDKKIYAVESAIEILEKLKKEGSEEI